MTARRPAEAPAPPPCVAFRKAITRELARLILGQRGPQRPELAIEKNSETP